MNVQGSYRYCKMVTKEKAKNFYYGILPLPKPKRNALYALYAFMRQCDDIADDPGVTSNKKQNLDKWRAITQDAIKGTFNGHPELPAFRDCLLTYQIPHHYFFELIDGVEMDLTTRRFNQFSDLYQYCYRVASVVGLCCLHVYGFKDEQAKELAIECGIAFQLTNILRDLKDDASMGRIYLPLEDLQQFGYSEDNLMQSKHTSAFDQLLDFEFDRAQAYYKKGKRLVDFIEPDSQFALRTIIGIYESLLKKLMRQRNDILRKKINLTLLEKLRLLAKSVIN